MSFIGKTFSKVAAGTMVAGFMLVGGVGVANAAETSGDVSQTGVISLEAPALPPVPPPTSTDGPGELPPPSYDDGDLVVTPEPTKQAPGKSGDHRASTPQKALDNNQSHKQDEKKAEKAEVKAEKKAAKGK